MSRQTPPGHPPAHPRGHLVDLVDLVHVEALERALLDGVKSDGVDLHELLSDGGSEQGGRVRVDLGLVPVFSDERPLLGLAGLIDWRGSGRLSALIRSGFCTATAGEQLLLPCDRRLPIDRLVLVGLGARASFDDAQARAVARQLVKISTGLQARSVLIALPTRGIDRALTEAVFEALLLAIEELAEPPESAPSSEPIAAAVAVAVEGGGDSPSEVMIDPSGGPPGEPAAEPGSDADLPQAPVSIPDPPAAPESPESEVDVEVDVDVSSARWWVAVDEAVVARLRRVLSGPPRAARGGAGLHT